MTQQIDRSAALGGVAQEESWPDHLGESSHGSAQFDGSGGQAETLGNDGGVEGRPKLSETTGRLGARMPKSYKPEDISIGHPMTAHSVISIKTVEDHLAAFGPRDRLMPADCSICLAAVKLRMHPPHHDGRENS